MSQIEELADRVERLLLRHEEVRRTNALLREQLAAVAHERDNLRSGSMPRAAGSTSCSSACRATPRPAPAATPMPPTAS
jgi:hypothetical protein